MLAGLYKDIFNDLNDFCEEYFHFNDEIISRFSKEIQFYLSWLDFINPSRQVGLPFCYPQICDSAEYLYYLDGFDLPLARLEQDRTVVNDFILKKPEHIIVVTGPNQGGKTTFARVFGQIHYLASLGLCVPGREAALYLFDNIFTHFGREEDLSTLNGKLQDDLVRLRALLNAATDRSIIIVNEIFASTTLNDALTLGQLMMDAFIELGAPSLIVTFLDELASHGSETVSMMSTVKEDDPTRRTFKIVRKPPDGLAYALHIARKHNLTYEQLCGRLGRQSKSNAPGYRLIQKTQSNERTLSVHTGVVNANLIRRTG
jgi:DNA mismatch repair ATPase MutS